MGWNQIEYIDVVAVPRLPVKKQMWNGAEFVPILTYRLDKTMFSTEQIKWLHQTFGRSGVQQVGHYWDFSKAGDFVVMDEKVYVVFQLKWGSE